MIPGCQSRRMPRAQSAWPKTTAIRRQCRSATLVCGRVPNSTESLGRPPKQRPGANSFPAAINKACRPANHLPAAESAATGLSFFPRPLPQRRSRPSPSRTNTPTRSPRSCTPASDRSRRPVPESREGKQNVEADRHSEQRQPERSLGAPFLPENSYGTEILHGRTLPSRKLLDTRFAEDAHRCSPLPAEKCVRRRFRL